MIWWIIRRIIQIIVQALQLRHVAGWGAHILLSLFTPLAQLFINRRVVRLANRDVVNHTAEAERMDAAIRQSIENFHVNARALFENDLTFANQQLELVDAEAGRLPMEHAREHHCVVQ